MLHIRCRDSGARGKREVVSRSYAAKERAEEPNCISARRDLGPIYRRFEKTIRHARQLRTVQAPLFPRYLFVILDLERDRWLSVRSTVGVSRLFTTQDGRPIPVPGGIVESLIERSDGNVTRLDDRPRQRAARSHPVRPFCRFRGDARAAGRGRTGKGFARNDGDRGPCHASPFGACAGGIKLQRAVWRAAPFGVEIG